MQQQLMMQKQHSIQQQTLQIQLQLQQQISLRSASSPFAASSPSKINSDTTAAPVPQQSLPIGTPEKPAIPEFLMLFIQVLLFVSVSRVSWGSRCSSDDDYWIDSLLHMMQIDIVVRFFMNGGPSSWCWDVSKYAFIFLAYCGIYFSSIAALYNWTPCFCESLHINISVRRRFARYEDLKNQFDGSWVVSNTSLNEI